MTQNSNLLNKINNNTFELDSSVVKISILGFIGLIFSFFFGCFLKLFMLGGGYNFLLYSFLAGIGFLAVYLLNVFFVKTFWINNVIVFVEVLVLLLSFYDTFSKFVGLAGLIGFFLLVWGIRSGKEELEDRLKIKFWGISKKSMPKAITGLALITSVVSVGYFSLEENNFFISKSAFEKNISPVLGVDLIQNFVPGFDLSLSVDNLIENIAANQIERNSGLKTLPSDVKAELTIQTAKELENDISKFIGAPLDAGARASEELYKIMVRKISQAPENNKSLILVIVNVLIFLTIVGLSWAIRFIATVPAYIVYEICLALGFSTIMLEDKSKEVVVLK